MVGCLFVCMMIPGGGEGKREREGERDMSWDSEGVGGRGD